MPETKLGAKVLVDTFKVHGFKNGEPTKEIPHEKLTMFVEMDGFSWDSDEYSSLAEFLQAIVDHAYEVSMGNE
jgi:hypothetical protein